jgi:hypothetical protein
MEPSVIEPCCFGFLFPNKNFLEEFVVNDHQRWGRPYLTENGLRLPQSGELSDNSAIQFQLH